MEEGKKVAREVVGQTEGARLAKVPRGAGNLFRLRFRCLPGRFLKVPQLSPDVSHDPSSSGGRFTGPWPSRRLIIGNFTPFAISFL